MTASTTPSNKASRIFNRTLFILMVSLAVIFTFLGDYGMAASDMGLALVFDPFNASVPWNSRPLVQRIIPLVVLVMAIGLFVVAIQK